MNRNLWLLAIAQGLLLTNNITFVAINGLVGLSLAPLEWLATLPIMGYVIGGALSTGAVAWTQTRLGRKRSFQLGLVVALLSSLLCAYAAMSRNFWLLITATVIAGYYNANGQLYRFAAAELTTQAYREKAISLVLAGGLMGAVLGPNLAARTRNLLDVAYTGAYLSLALVAAVSFAVLSFIEFPSTPARSKKSCAQGRRLSEIMRQPVFLVSAAAAALGYGVMNLLMSATPIAMQHHHHSFESAALVLEWHVIGMFAPGFFTGHLIKRFGVLTIMAVGVVLNFLCVAIALSGVDVMQFLVSLFILGVGWNFLFTSGTALALQSYAPEEKDKAQAAINFCVFAVMAVSSFSSGALVTTQGWTWLNIGSLIPVTLTGIVLLWYVLQRRASARA